MIQFARCKIYWLVKSLRVAEMYFLSITSVLKPLINSKFHSNARKLNSKRLVWLKGYLDSNKNNHNKCEHCENWSILCRLYEHDIEWEKKTTICEFMDMHASTKVVFFSHHKHNKNMRTIYFCSLVPFFLHQCRRHSDTEKSGGGGGVDVKGKLQTQK